MKLDLKSSEVVANKTINARNIANNEFNLFEFKPIDDSKDKSYYFFLESPDSASENAIAIWYTLNITYKEGSGFIGNKETEIDLTFRTYYKTDLYIILYHFLARAILCTIILLSMRQNYLKCKA
ncbi:MAG: hypothetical protein NWF08_08885 [Candidatus Bathyarchaeota archaeon]|nr:hypothetical protein [Candidatus Bathyarchaeota archaeon]